MNDHGNSEDNDPSTDRQRELIDGAFEQVQQAAQQTVTMTQPGGGGEQVSVPAMIGNAKIESQIGRGGMGVVYRAWDSVLHRHVAVKFLPGVAADENDPHFQQFFGGARAEAGVRHANIVTVYAAGLVEGVPYIVMDYIDGPTLREIARRSEPLPFSAVVKIMWDVSGAVAALHQRGIIHRDLKPGNVLFDREGHLLVTDFGLAALRQRSDAPVSAAGTPAYMAPELFDGKVSPQSDVYAMGIMLFELLSGRLPFTGDPAALRDQHVSAPLPVDELPDSIPPSVVEIVERATQKKALFRYKSAEHFQRALRDGVATEEMLRKGAGKLKRVVLELHRSKPTGEDETPKDEEPTTSTYFERLSDMAAMRQTERGAPAPAQESGSGILAATRDTLRADISCTACGYNLRGLSAAGSCPECNASVSFSLRPDRLIFASPRSLSRIALGEKVLLLTIVAIVIDWIVRGVLGEREWEALASWVWLGVALALLAGVFLTTAGTSDRSVAGRPLSGRWGARIFTSLFVLTQIVGLLLPEATSTPLAEPLRILTALTVALAGVGFFRYLASLADRIPDSRLAAGSCRMAILWGGLVLLRAAALPYFEHGSLARGEVSAETVLVMFIVFFAASLILLSYQLFFRHRKAMKRAAAHHVPHGAIFGDVPTDKAIASSGNIDIPRSATP